MVVFDGCGVLRIQGVTSWGRGAGGRARWPRLDGVGRRVLALSLPRISKFTLHQCAGGGLLGGVLVPDWAGRLLQPVVAC